MTRPTDRPGRQLLAAAARAQGLALVAQALGAGQLALLVTRAGPSRATDAYLILFTFAQTPITLWVLGTVYPRRLAAGPGQRWRSTVVGSGLLAALSVAGGGAYLGVIGYPLRTVVPLAAALAVTAAVLGAATCQAVRLACSGRPAALAGVAVPGNAAALATLALAPPDRAVLAMAAVLVPGTLVALAATTWKARAAAPATDNPRPVPAAGPLVLASVLSGVGGLLLQAALAHLPAGQTTVFGVASKAGLAVTVVLVNAALPLLVNWHTYAQAGIRRACLVLCAAAPALGTATSAVAAAVALPPGLDPAVCGLLAAAVVLAAANSAAVQATMRTGRFRALALSSAAIAPVYVVGAAAGYVSQSGLPIAAALAGTAAVSTAILFWRLGWRAETVAAAVAAAAVPAVAWSAPAAVALTAAGAAAACCGWSRPAR